MANIKLGQDENINLPHWEILVTFSKYIHPCGTDTTLLLW